MPTKPEDMLPASHAVYWKIIVEEDAPKRPKQPMQLAERGSKPPVKRLWPRLPQGVHTEEGANHACICCHASVVVGARIMYRKVVCAMRPDA
eukprot:1136530-Pelagomonas_calceolata.AAC.2